MTLRQLLKYLNAIYQTFAAVCVILVGLIFYTEKPIYAYRVDIDLGLTETTQAEKPLCGSCRRQARRTTSPFK